MKSSNPLTKEDIVSGLRQLGLSRGAAVEVHSSFRSLGPVKGGPHTVIEAILECVGEEGAVVMSAYPVTLPLPLSQEDIERGIIAKVRFLPIDSDCRTGMGIIADEFKKWPGTVLGKGIHRVCAWGKDASLHSQGYEYLLSNGGWVLLIGVDIHRCSSMHCAESRAGLPEVVIQSAQPPADILRDYPEDQWYIQYGDPPEDAWGKIQAEAEQRGLINRQEIGKAKCMLFRGREVVEIYEQHLRKDPYNLFGLQPNREA